MHKKAYAEVKRALKCIYQWNYIPKRFLLWGKCIAKMCILSTNGHMRRNSNQGVDEFSWRFFFLKRMNSLTERERGGEHCMDRFNHPQHSPFCFSDWIIKPAILLNFQYPISLLSLQKICQGPEQGLSYHSSDTWKKLSTQNHLQKPVLWRLWKSWRKVEWHLACKLRQQNQHSCFCEGKAALWGDDLVRSNSMVGALHPSSHLAVAPPVSEQLPHTCFPFAEFRPCIFPLFLHSCDMPNFLHGCKIQVEGCYF